MDQEKISNLIKTIRKEYNLTQQELGDSLGVTAQAVSKWENGKNIPDIAVLKEISDKYNIDINNILSGQNIKKKKSKIRFIMLGVIALLLILLIIVLINNNDKFRSTIISSSCKEFNLQGVLSYDKSKTAISISKIEYCGNEGNKKYEELSCTLYEKTKDDKITIATCNNEKNITLKEYLDKLSFNITNYEQKCRTYKSNIISLEIKGLYNNKEDKYVIPLSLEEDC